MSDKIVEIQRENNDKFDEGKSRVKNEQLVGENDEAINAGNSSKQEELAILQSADEDIFEDDALEEAELFVPNWLIEVLAFISRKEMANSSLSTASKIFKLLCWPKLHQKVKPHKLPNLIGFYNRDTCGAEFTSIDTNEVIPIASSPAPPYIDGIGKIELSFVNEQIVQFIKSIDNLIQSCDLCVFFKFTSHQLDKKRIASMHTLMEFLATKIVKFTITNYGYAENPLNDFNVMFPGILEQIQMLSFYQPLKIFEFNILMNWLTKQTNDGKQKIIQFHDNQEQDCLAFINRIKQEFSASNSPANFLISFAEFFEPYQRIEDFDDDEDEFVEFYQNVEEFTLENERTNEILTSYRRQNCYHQFFIARYPKGEEYWTEEGEKKIQKAPWPSTLSDEPSIVIEA